MIKATDQISLARVSDGQDADKQYFFHDDAGAHVTTSPDNANSGSNLLMTSEGVKIRDGVNEVASFTKDGVTFSNGETPFATLYPAENSGNVQAHLTTPEGGASIDLYENKTDGGGQAFFSVKNKSQAWVDLAAYSENYSVDWGINLFDDVVYLGARYSSKDGSSGRLFRINKDFGKGTLEAVIDDKPFLWKESIKDGWYCTQSPEGMLTMRKRVAVTFGSTWTAVGGHYRNVQTLTLPFDIPYEDRIEMSGMAASSGMLAFVNSDNNSIGLNKVELMAYKENSGNASYSVNMAITITAKTNVELGDANTEEIVNNRLSEIENGSY